MGIIFVFLFLLVIENIFLPALIGPGRFLIVPIFILGLLLYSRSWRTLAYQAIPFVLIAEFFTGSSTGSFLVPFAITAVIYILINKFIGLSENLQENISFSGIAVSALILAGFTFLYSGFFIFLNGSYDIGAGWNEFRLFFTGSLLSILGWSAAISVLFKYVLRTK